MKVAILGGTLNKDDSPEYKLAQTLGRALTENGHQIFAFGSKGVPAAGVVGAHQADTGQAPKSYTDMGDSRHVPQGNAIEDSYTGNLPRFIHAPDAHIFVDSGAMGTHLQLMTLLMYAVYGLKNPEEMNIIIYRPFSQVLLRDAFGFCAKARANMPECVHVVDKPELITALLRK